MIPKKVSQHRAFIFYPVFSNAEERAFFTGDGDKKPLGILDETGGAELGVTAASQTAITFDEIFDLYYSLKSPYRRNAQFVCNETILLQLMKLKDKNDNYLWKPSLDIAKPDTLLGRPIRTSSFMPGIAKGERVLLFGDMKNYWVADRQNRTFRRLNELYARTDQVGFLTTQRVDGRLILPESVKVALITTDFATDILGEQLDSKGVLVERNDAETSQFALLFEFDGDKNHIRHVLYCCSASRPATEGQTTEESKDVKTETLSLKASALPSGLVKSKTCESTDETTYNNAGGVKKKSRPVDREMTTPLFLLRCVQIGLSLSDLDLLTIGMVNEMFIEKDNDDYDYPIKADQAAFDRF